MYEKDTISINSEFSDDVPATGARITVNLEGSSFFSGRQAFSKAQEVRKLVGDLAEEGVNENDIELLAVSLKTDSGLLRSTSSVKYSFSINIDEMENLAKVIGVIASQKKASISDIDWKYDGLDQKHEELLALAIDECERRADLICKSIKHERIGVNNLSFNDTGAEREERNYSMLSAPGVMRRQKLDNDDFGMELKHIRKAAVSVTIYYLVKPLPNKSD